MNPREEVYNSEYHRVWKALQVAMALYPIQKNDVDEGLLETKLILPQQIWQNPIGLSHEMKSTKYRLVARIFEGSLNGKSVVRVSIKKEIRYKTNIIDDARILPSDGLEEEVLLYRVRRELEFERVTEKSAN